MGAPIEACGRCGSVRLKMRTIHDGGLGAGYGGITPGVAVCQECEWQGTPLVFDELDDWRAFQEGAQA